MHCEQLLNFNTLRITSILRDVQLSTAYYFRKQIKFEKKKMKREQAVITEDDELLLPPNNAMQRKYIVLIS